MNARRLVLLLGPLLAMGCGNDDSSPITPAEFDNRYAQEICAQVSPACLTPETSCVAYQLGVRAQKDQQAVGLGRSFLPANAEACLGTVSSVYGQLHQRPGALSAGDLHILEQSCNQVYRGAKLANQECSFDEDCISGLICDLGKAGVSGRCGTQTMVLEGAGCANIGEICPVGFFCGNAAGVFTCQPKLGLAASCDLVPCLEDLRCAGGICVTQFALGQACTLDQECSTGFCEPYALVCADYVGFAIHSAACQKMGGT
jgi:hypothetical protein